MKKLFTMLVSTGIAICSYAQQPSGKITGSIKDGGNQAIIDAASISLLKSLDSSLVKISLTDKQGNFVFENVKPGNYIVMATSTGHAKVYSSPLAISETNSEQSTGILQLQPSAQNLGAVTVVSKRQFIERKIDKTVINPDAMISNAGSSALEMLEKAPGVSVDKDGKISLKGKQGVIVMIDGKPSYMTGTDLVNYLSNMPSGNIDQVELMSNPPAKFDASGNSGVINIKLKKNRQKGFNGSLSTSQAHGKYFRSSNTLNINYRRGKLNTFSTFNANYRENPQWLDINRDYLASDKTVQSIFEQASYRMRITRYFNARVGADYLISPKTTLGVVLTGYTNPSQERATNQSLFFSPSMVLDSSMKNKNTDDNVWNHAGANLNFRHRFDSTGKELTFDIDYLTYNSQSKNTMLNTGLNADNSQKYQYLMSGDLPSELKIFSAKADYVQTISKNIKMETGIKSSIVETDNRAKYFNHINGSKTPDYTRTNFFNYKENGNAAYVNFSTEIKKWGFQAGLRVENTNYEGLQYGNPTRQDSAFSKSYTNAFPTAYVSYRMNDKNQFGLSVGRRINRPDYGHLNPFIHFIDPYTYEVGNPFLKPMFSNSAEISYGYKELLNTSLNYTYTKDLFGESFAREDSAIVVRNSNFGKSHAVNLSVGLQLPVAKWWKSSINVQGDYGKLNGVLNGNEINVNITSLGLNINNQFTFNNGWSAELSGFYRTKANEGQIVIRKMMQLNAGVQKLVLKKKGTLRLSINDFTGPMRVSGYLADVSGASAGFKQKRDSRIVGLSFNYRFGKMYKADKRKSGGAGDEQNRVGGGGGAK